MKMTSSAMTSSLRNLGQPHDSVELLTAELAAGSDPLDDAVRAFLALALADTGREREAVSLALAALAPHLPRYQRSLANYAPHPTTPVTNRPSNTSPSTTTTDRAPSRLSCSTLPAVRVVAVTS